MISKNEIQQLSDEELTKVLSDVLLQTLLRQGKDERRIPDGIELSIQTENFNIKFDIDVDVVLSDKCFGSFIKKFAGLNHGRSIHIYGAGELNE